MSEQDVFNGCRSVPELCGWAAKLESAQKRDDKWHVEMAWLRILAAKYVP